MTTSADSLGLYSNPSYNMYNLYANNDTTRDDFMARAYANAGDTVSFQGYTQPSTDTFEKSDSSGSGFSTGLKLGTVAGLGTGAGMYFFGPGPVKDGKFNDDILKAVDIDVKQVAKEKAEQLLADKKAKIYRNAKVTLPEGIIPENIKAYAETGIAPDELKKAMSREQAQTISKQLSEIDMEQIVKEAHELAVGQTLQGQKDKLAKLQSQRAKLESLADDADLEKFFKENAETFGLKGDEKAIEKQAKELAATYENKAGAVADYTRQISRQETLVKSTRDTLNSRMSSYYDDAAKSLKASAPEKIQQAFKNFKWKSAGKWAAIAAGAGLVLGWMFGGNNKK